MEAEQTSIVMPSLAENRVTVLSTAYLLPTSVAVGISTVFCVLVAAPGLLMIAGQESREVAMGELRVLGFSVGWIAAWSVYQIVEQIRWRRYRDWIWRLEASSEARLRTDQAFCWKMDYDKKNWTSRDLLKALGNVALPMSFLLLFLFFRDLRSLDWFRPRPLEEFSNFQTMWGSTLFVCSLLSHAPVRQGELKLSETGLLLWKSSRVEIVPWTLVEKVIWKEPRWGALEMELLFRTKGFFERKGKKFSFVNPSEEDRERMLAGLRKYATVETLWGQGSGGEQRKEVASEVR